MTASVPQATLGLFCEEQPIGAATFGLFCGTVVKVYNIVTSSVVSTNSATAKVIVAPSLLCNLVVRQTTQSLVSSIMLITNTMYVVKNFATKIVTYNIATAEMFSLAKIQASLSSSSSIASNTTNKSENIAFTISLVKLHHTNYTTTSINYQVTL